MKNRTNSCKKWLAVLLSVSMLPTAILQNGSMAYAEEKKQEEAVTAEEALEDREADIVVEEISISNKEEFLKYENKIKHIHLHDFNGSKDHQELFTGLLNAKEELAFCNKHNLDVLIEVKRKEELINSVNKLHNLGYIQ